MPTAAGDPPAIARARGAAPSRRNLGDGGGESLAARACSARHPAGTSPAPSTRRIATNRLAARGAFPPPAAGRRGGDNGRGFKQRGGPTYPPLAAMAAGLPVAGRQIARRDAGQFGVEGTPAVTARARRLAAKSAPASSAARVVAAATAFHRGEGCARSAAARSAAPRRGPSAARKALVGRRWRRRGTLAEAAVPGGQTVFRASSRAVAGGGIVSASLI